jgi:hypothetical protein
MLKPKISRIRLVVQNALVITQASILFFHLDMQLRTIAQIVGLFRIIGNPHLPSSTVGGTFDPAYPLKRE